MVEVEHMNIFRRMKLRRQREEGLFLLLDGLKVQLDQAKWHLEIPELPEGQRNYWKIRFDVIRFWRDEVQDAMDGKLHL